MIKPHTDLPRLVRDGADIPLVPDSGIQFVDVPLPLVGIKLTRPWFEQRDVDGLSALKPVSTISEPDGYCYEADGKTIEISSDDPEFFTLDTKSALQPFLAKWIPAPYLQVEVVGPPGRRRFAPGPQNWARLRIVELSPAETGGYTHRCVIAFDTATMPRTSEAAFLAPWQHEPARFALATKLEEVSWLLAQDWMRGWLAELYRERDPSGRPAAPDAPIGCRHYAAYLTLLAALEEAGACRPVRLIDLAAAEKRNAYVDVDLVLDLGNSRSCGFLVEQAPGRDLSIADAYRLALRDLSMPESLSDLPFESRVEFARPSFGKEEWSLQSGRGDAFDWPSPVRVGPEAVRLSSLCDGNQGQTGLSSPKRYLWDNKPRLMPWRFNPTSDPEGVIRGSYLRYLAEDGSVLSMKKSGGIALSAMFSRSSLFTLMLLEVLLQARSQVNSFAARYGRQEMAAPRRIARIILTVPPAMPLEEVRIVRERAKAAAYLLKDVTIDAAPRVMEVEAQLDEAMATQIVYLYDQISHAYRGDAPDYLELAGRSRTINGGQPQPSLRIASIDIGGGTTDLAICTYVLNARVVTPREEFREGFRIAGDDVLETVVMRHVMPGVRRALASAGLGMDRAKQLLNSLFRSPAGTEPERQARRLMLSHVLAPAALGLLSEYESWNPIQTAGVERRTIGQLLAGRSAELRAVNPDLRGKSRDHGSPHAAAWLNERAAESGTAGFAVEEVVLTLDFAAIHQTVRETLKSTLEPLCEIIHRFGCDTLLLSGRGVRWPAAPELVMASMAIEPHRVQPMHRYRVGAWYPFADGAGRIFDPKTTVAVGAMLNRLLRGGQLDNLALVNKFGLRSTARYVGLMENDNRIRRDRILFDGFDVETDDEREAKISFSGRTLIGFKQFRADRWPASPLYRLELAADKASGVTLPVTLTIRRKLTSDEEGTVMKIEVVERSERTARDEPLKERTLLCSLQTLPGEEGSHWMDAGQLATLDVFLDADSDAA